MYAGRRASILQLAHKLKYSNTVPFVIGLSFENLNPPFSHLQSIDATNLTKLSETLINIASSLGQSPLPKDVDRCCSEFIDEIKSYITAFGRTDIPILADRSLVPQDMIDQLGKRLENKLEQLIGNNESLKAFDDDKECTEPPDPQVDVATKQALELKAIGVHLPAKLVRALARKSYLSGDLESAYVLLSQITASKDSYPGDYYNLGLVSSKIEKTEEAEFAFRKVIKINPSHTDAWCYLGTLLSDGDRAEEAESVYVTAIETNPDCPDLRNELAYLLWTQKKFSEAEIQIQEALKQYPNHSYANATLGLLLFEQNKLDEGIFHYKKAIEISPDDLPLQQKFHYEYSRALARSKKLAEAREQAEMAKNIDTDFIPAEDIETLLHLIEEQSAP